MAEPQIRFDDGDAYERMMGVWSRITGEKFLDWLQPPPGLRWVDVGCGNGAFTELLVSRCRPAAIAGVDPSPAQLAFARSRPAAKVAEFQQGDAMALPFADDSFDAAVMALVIFFVPDPAKGVAEMARVVKPGGVIAAYAWDVFGEGLPAAPIQAEMRMRGIKPPWPPSPEASRIDDMRALWAKAGLVDVRTTTIPATRTFAGFDEFWSVNLLGASVAAVIDQLPPAEVEQLKQAVRARLPAQPDGRIIAHARANAVAGRAPV